MLSIYVCIKVPMRTIDNLVFIITHYQQYQ